MEIRTLEDLKAQVGQTWPPFTYTMESGLVERYRQAVGEEPTDADTTIVPLGLLPTLGFEHVISLLLGLRGIVLHGSTDLNCLQAVHVGDSIDVVVTVASVRERKMENGEVAFVTIENKYHNQERQVVATCRQLAMLRWE